MFLSWTLLFLVGFIQGRPKACDPIFDSNCSERQVACDPEDIFSDACDISTNTQACDPEDIFSDACDISSNTRACDPEDVFADCECFDSTNEIENAVFSGDTRQAFNDCDPTSSCVKYIDEGYVCAPSWTCTNNTIITDGKGLINVRTDFRTLDASDSKCEKIDHVCCKKPNFRADKFPPITRVKENYARCGRSSPVLKITGQDKNSQDAQPGEFPHMCVVYRFEQGQQRIYVSGASLIARNKVITVAHKFLVNKKSTSTDWRDSASDFYIRCGEYNVKTNTELLDSQETQVERIILHPQYNARRLHFNLAIIQTKENFVYQKHISPVCLPKPFQNFENERNCWSSGWGADTYDSYGQYSDSLKKVQMPGVSTSECETRMRNTDRFRNKAGFRIHSSWICFGGEKGKDTCKGDGGSPHVCKNTKDEWVQAGVVAWGIGCGDELPSVYSSIPDAMCWIDWVMSCLPIAEYDIDNTFVEDLDIRGTNVASVNRLSNQDCGDWMQSSFDLKNICGVSYQDIDERNVK